MVIGRRISGLGEPSFYVASTQGNCICAYGFAVSIAKGFPGIPMSNAVALTRLKLSWHITQAFYLSFSLQLLLG
jgi:hypothetical protein